MFMTCHLCCCNIWLETFVTSPTTEIKLNNHNIIIHSHGIFHSRQLPMFKNTLDLKSKTTEFGPNGKTRENRTNCLEQILFSFPPKKHFYVFYIYLFIALGIFQKHKFVNFWKDCYAWLGSDTGAPYTEAILSEAKTV